LWHLNFFFNVIKKLNSANDNNSYWLRQLIYIFMIDEHIILIEFGSNSFNVTCEYSKKKYLWIKMFEMNDIMVKKNEINNLLNNHLLGIKKNIT
jgi:hypothetical protein